MKEKLPQLGILVYVEGVIIMRARLYVDIGWWLFGFVVGLFVRGYFIKKLNKHGSTNPPEDI